MNYCLNFTDPAATKPGRAGGKGANLAILTQGGFPVPRGFIITAQGYLDFVSTVPADLLTLHDGPAEQAGPGAESKRIRAILGGLALPETVLDEVHRQLSAWPATQAFSVRSSSTMEDLASAAFAGQHETFLNCVDPAQILEKVKACYLSLWLDRAIAYRAHQGFPHALAAMAVVVQEMVQCDVAGVAFSINPINGNLNEMVIDANFGLGESVVSGEAEVDHFIIDKSSRTVRIADIARKSRKVVAVSGGTATVALSTSESEQPCLGSEQIRQISQIALEVEASYHFPQDIEWGIAQGKLFLLQSRPVTTIPPRWTRDESAERFPNVITPLTWDFVESGFHRSLNHSFKLIGFPAMNGKWFAMHGHYIYGNQNAVDLYARRSPLRVRDLDELRAVLPSLRQQFAWVQQLPITWMRDLDYYLIRLGEFQAEPLEQKSLAELWQFVLAVNEHGANYFLPNIAISITQSSLFRLLNYLLKLAVGPERAERLFAQLTCFCETKTGIINKELFELATVIRESPNLEGLLTNTDSREIVNRSLLREFPAFHERFAKFLRDHGHREVDFDAYSPTWLEIPWVVLDNLRLILQAPIREAPTMKERQLKIQMQHAEHELFTLLPDDLHFFFAELLRLTRLYTSLDDLEHYQTTRLTLPLRRGLLELGQRLTEMHCLTGPTDIFFAHSDQINHLLKTLSELRAGETANVTGEFSQLVHQQKQAYLADKSRKPDWVPGESAVPETTGDALTGLPGSPGQAEGEAFLVSGPEDFARFPKGAILVARTTNPAWTPLFYSAAAVVTEAGGPLSHGAVTAREMQLPAVMSVKNSLTRIHTGQKLRVDGTTGKVFVLN